MPTIAFYFIYKYKLHNSSYKNLIRFHLFLKYYFSFNFFNHNILHEFRYRNKPFSALLIVRINIFL